MLSFYIILHNCGGNIGTRITVNSRLFLDVTSVSTNVLLLLPDPVQDTTLHLASLFFTEMLWKPTGGWSDVNINCSLRGQTEVPRDWHHPERHGFLLRSQNDE